MSVRAREFSFGDGWPRLAIACFCAGYAGCTTGLAEPIIPAPALESAGNGGGAGRTSGVSAAGTGFGSSAGRFAQAPGLGGRAGSGGGLVGAAGQPAFNPCDGVDQGPNAEREDQVLGLLNDAIEDRSFCLRQPLQMSTEMRCVARGWAGALEPESREGSSLPKLPLPEGWISNTPNGDSWSWSKRNLKEVEDAKKELLKNTEDLCAAAERVTYKWAGIGETRDAWVVFIADDDSDTR